jgi:hypothetical protein
MQALNPEGMAVLWFPNKEEYSKYQEVCEDSDPMCEYEVWLERAKNAGERMKVKIIPVYANAEAFSGFCQRGKIKPDAMGRSAFAAFLFKDQHESRN